MAQITIVINSREYAIACDDGQEAYTLKLAAMLDEKARQLTAGGAHINENMLLAMVGLLLADELAEMRRKYAGLQQTAGSISQAAPAARPAVPVPAERGVEKIAMPDLASVDGELAAAITGISQQIKMLAKEIETL